MYIDDFTLRKNEKSYRRVLIRESYRTGKKVNKRTLANITHASESQIQAIKFALANSDQVATMKNLTEANFFSGKSVGSVAALYQIAQKLGFLNALGRCMEAVLFLWLVFARLIEQGSRLSAVRLARQHTVSEIMGINKFDENALYRAMDWGCANQEKIESKLFSMLECDIDMNGTNKKRNKGKGKGEENPCENVFLYDVTSTYLEGTQNELAAYGYNRDKKIGKQQIVYGLLTDENGTPLSVEAFKGNTKDNKTLNSQITKLRERFGFKYLTIVGDKGMIKRMQITEIVREQFNYITSITKPQIEQLLKRQVIEMELFEDKLCEVFDEEEGLRYVLRRNARRAQEMKQTRHSKLSRATVKVQYCNQYLSEHKRAKVQTQVKNMTQYLCHLKLDKYVKVTGDVQARIIRLEVNEEKLDEISKLDGCYVIKTDLKKSQGLKKETIHNRYKALSEVEWAFRTQKTGYLEVRPVFVRKEIRTRAHLLITMLSYRLEQFLRKAWKDIDLSVEEGIKQLTKITTVVIEIGKEKLHRIPKPDQTSKKLLDAVGVKLPTVLPLIKGEVDTKIKLQNYRK
jgi:transposase